MSKHNDRDIFSLYDSEAPIATDLRRIYRNMLSHMGDKKHRSFLVTSATKGEGKSTVAAFLALTIAHYPNQKVVVLDADLRRPRMHQLFGVAKSPGFSECLDRGVEPLTVVQKTSLPNLDVISAGEAVKAPSELFESRLLSDFFAKVRFYYDVVLVDSPPVLAVSDTLFLCSEVEAVLYVVLAGVTARDVALRGTQVLQDSQANILGVVVNNASDVLPYYYDYKYYRSYERRS